MHVSNLFHNPFQGPLARKLAQWSGLDRVFFTNSGAEAIEGALKLARAYAYAKSASDSAVALSKKTRILALENSFHGRTMGALSITHTPKYREPFAPLIPGVEFVRFNDVADLDAKFDSTVCAIVLETIQGEGGIFPVSEEFWERARVELYITTLRPIADEIQTVLAALAGNSRTRNFESGNDICLPLRLWLAAFPSAQSSPMSDSLRRLLPECTALLLAAARWFVPSRLNFLAVMEDEDLLANILRAARICSAALEKAGGAI